MGESTRGEGFCAATVCYSSLLRTIRQRGSRGTKTEWRRPAENVEDQQKGLQSGNCASATPREARKVAAQAPPSAQCSAVLDARSAEGAAAQRN